MHEGRSRWGLFIAGLGCCLTGLGLAISLPMMHAGLGLGLCGAIIAGAPLWRWPGFWPSLALSAWVLLSLALADSDGRWRLGALYGPWFGALVWWVARDETWRRRIITAVCIAVIAAGSLGLIQFLMGYDKDARPLRIDWEGLARFGRTSGFFSIHLTQGYVLAAVCLALAQPALLRQFQEADNPRFTIWKLSGQILSEAPLLGMGSKDLFRERYQTLLAEQRPDLVIPWDPAAPEPAYAAWPVLAEHGQIQEILTVWRETHVDDPMRSVYEADMRLLFGTITGTAAFFPEGAPHAHHSILGLAALHGLPAALAWLALIAVVAIQGWRLRKVDREAAGILLGAAGLAVAAGQFEYFAGDAEAGYATFLAVGLGGALARRSEALYSPPFKEAA
jgi:hypothetical protein